MFQNSFWINLHQFVRGEARRRSVDAPAELDLASLGEADRAAWTSALNGYTDLATKNLVFDTTLVEIVNALAGVSDMPRLPDGVIDQKIEAALNEAAPIYRARAWPRHRQANEAWMEQARSLLREHEAAVAAALAAAYHARWPTTPILVDAVCEAGPNAAYTHSGPAGFGAHTLLNARNPRNQGHVLIELLFHEAAHSAAVEDRIRAMIAEESSHQRLAEPENLWHAMIFFTTGAVVRRQLAKAGDTQYVPYAYRYDVYSQGMEADRASLELNWQPYLDRKISFERALRDLVRDAR